MWKCLRIARSGSVENLGEGKGKDNAWLRVITISRSRIVLM